MVIRNTNLGEEFQSFYYYKDGYIFFTLAETEEAYKTEVEAINADFEGAVNSPFYASKINAFRLSSEGPDGYQSVYICQQATFMAIIGGAVDLVLMALAIVSFAVSIKAKYKEE